MKELRRLIDVKDIVRTIEAHNGVSAFIGENAEYKKGGIKQEFDALWLSSLTDSTAKGKPDIEYVDLTSRMATLNDILEVTIKPIIYDGNSGGLTEHFILMVRTLERLGVSAVIIEDKIGLKRNSLLPESKQPQDTIENFADKISRGKKAQVMSDFMIIARIESLILGAGQEDAIKRAKGYIEAGADGIMIHSKKDTPDEIFEFCRRYSKLEKTVPLVAVPTTYSKVTEKELKDAGIKIVIYANQLSRKACKAMKDAASSILTHGTASAIEDIMTVQEMITMIPDGIKNVKL